MNTELYFSTFDFSERLLALVLFAVFTIVAILCYRHRTYSSRFAALIAIVMLLYYGAPKLVRINTMFDVSRAVRVAQDEDRIDWTLMGQECLENLDLSQIARVSFENPLAVKVVTLDGIKYTFRRRSALSYILVKFDEVEVNE